MQHMLPYDFFWSKIDDEKCDNTEINHFGYVFAYVHRTMTHESFNLGIFQSLHAKNWFMNRSIVSWTVKLWSSDQPPNSLNKYCVAIQTICRISKRILSICFFLCISTEIYLFSDARLEHKISILQGKG